MQTLPLSQLGFEECFMSPSYLTCFNLFFQLVAKQCANAWSRAQMWLPQTWFSGSAAPCTGKLRHLYQAEKLADSQRCFQHLKAVFANFEKEIGEFMKLSWYDQFLTPEDEADGVADHAGDGVDEDVKREVSAYVSKGLIMRLCTKLAKGHFELSLCKISTLVCT